MYKNLIANRAAKAQLVTALVLTSCAATSQAQISVSGQLRARGEWRQGFGNLLLENSRPASFISQRTRLTLGGKLERVSFGATLQDVRVWGQDASSVSGADGNRLMLHEGWAEILLASRADTTLKFKFIDQLSFKIGRQELVYDDARLIGNLDWLQQGRRFDMALLKAGHKNWQFDIGYAYNQNAENFAGNAYVSGNVPAYIKTDAGNLVATPAGMVPLISASGNSAAAGAPSYINPPSTNAASQNYKQFLSVYVAKKIGETKISGLFFNDNFSKYRVGSVSTAGGTVFGRFFDVGGSYKRYTYGAMASSAFGKPAGWGKVAFQGACYWQSGTDRDGRSLRAHHCTLQASYLKRKFTAGAGYDVLSGNKSTTASAENRSFDPLYGTPHKFWGLMDYFYAGTGSPTAGLNDAYLKSKFTSGRFWIAADYHHFNLANAIAATTTNVLGDEVDLTANYSLNKFTNVEMGCAVMKGTSSLPISKGQAFTSVYNKTGKWGYLMINIRPDFTSGKSKG